MNWDGVVTKGDVIILNGQRATVDTIDRGYMWVTFLDKEDFRDELKIGEDIEWMGGNKWRFERSMSRLPRKLKKKLKKSGLLATPCSKY